MGKRFCPLSHALWLINQVHIFCIHCHVGTHFYLCTAWRNQASWKSFWLNKTGLEQQRLFDFTCKPIWTRRHTIKYNCFDKWTQHHIYPCIPVFLPAPPHYHTQVIKQTEIDENLKKVLHGAAHSRDVNPFIGDSDFVVMNGWCPFWFTEVIKIINEREMYNCVLFTQSLSYMRLQLGKKKPGASVTLLWYFASFSRYMRQYHIARVQCEHRRLILDSRT